MDRNSFLSIFVSFFTIGLVYQIIQEEVMKNTFAKTFFTISNYSRLNESESLKTILTNKIDQKLLKYAQSEVLENFIRERKRNNGNYLTHRLVARLGNHFFETASFIGIAISNNMIPVFEQPACTRTLDFVSHNFTVIAPREKWTTFRERNRLAFDPRMMNISGYVQNKYVLVETYLQSYRYFEQYSDIIRHALMFNKETRLQSINFFLRCDISLLANSIWIGIHVRRGDIIKRKKLTEVGRITPRLSYYKNAITYFKDKYPHKNIILIVCGNDPKWNTENIAPLHNDVIISRGNTPCVDLAILSVCDHVIQSVGTFSWWAAYLSENESVYSAKVFAEGSRLDRQLNKTDYFLPHWIPMT